MRMSDYQMLLDCITRIAREAGEIIMPFFDETAELNVQHKADKTPLTAADLAAHEFIVGRLNTLTPDIPVLSEEGDIPDFDIRRQWKRYWIVDPLDGTRGFVNHSPEFTVNIALIQGHEPVIGVIDAPAFGVTYCGAKGVGAFKQAGGEAMAEIHTRKADWNAFHVLTGHYHGKKRFEKMKMVLGDFELTGINSSLKFCRLAEGSADIYPRFGPISEWDTAAGQCILCAAGGIVVDLKGVDVQYNAEPSLAHEPFVAIADPTIKIQLLEKLSSLG